MFSTKKNVLQLVSLLKKAGIRDYILCPGSRNIPLVQTIASIKEFHCYSVTDERSAGFYAIGLMQASGLPVAVCCTSGSAVLNLHPAVCEAYYQHLPLLLLTADRPQEWIGQMDGQTLPQTEAFGFLAKKCVSLPEIKDGIEKWYCNRLINEALYTLQTLPYGPVQINVPITEPFFDFSQTILPDERLITHVHAVQPIVPTELVNRLNKNQRIVLLIGQRSYQIADLKKLLKICENKGIVVLCEHLANIRSNYVINHFDELLIAKHNFRIPELVIYTGGNIVSKRLKKWLRTNTPAELWWVSDNCSMPDTFQHLTTTIETMAPYDFLTDLFSKLPNTDYRNIYAKEWEMGERKFLSHRIQETFENDFCDLSVLHRFVEELNKYPIESPSIQVANSSMVRHLQLFSLSTDIHVLCNRGVNGIEGSLSTAVGYALGHKGLTFCLIGDLSFFYDMNALWHTHLPANLRILLVNNGNGQIFHQLPQLESPYLDQYFAASHHYHAEGWAHDAGIIYLHCDSFMTLQRTWETFLSEKTERPVLLEVTTNPILNEKIEKKYFNRLKQIQL